MKKFSTLCATLSLSAALFVAVGPARADLQALGPVNPATGYPFWYQDTNGLALSLCLDQNGLCILPGAFVYPADRTGINAGNFPVESFYYLMDTAGTSPGGTISLTLYEAAVEAGFIGAVVDGGQAAFTRIRIRADVTQTGTYTVTHPYGTKTFNVDAIVAGNEINDTVDVPGLVLAPFDQNHPSLRGTPPLLPQDVGPFLRRADGQIVIDPLNPSNRYIGVPGAFAAVTGSPTGNNFVRITGPTADTLQLDTFSLMGKIVGIEVTPLAGANFGVYKLASPSTPVIFTATNFTGQAATIDPLVSSNPVFTVTPAADTCSNAVLTAIAPGNTCTFEVVFTPVADGPATGTITLSSATAPNAVVNVSGTGDGIAPTLALDPGQAAQFTKTASATISGTASDNIGVPTVQVSVNGTIQGSAAVTNGAWSFIASGLTLDAANAIAVTATDSALPAPGNQTTVNATVTTDTIAPTVAIDAVPATTNIDNQAITGTAADTNGVSSVSVSVNNVVQGLANVAGGTWSFNVANLTPNVPSNITAIAADPAGNQTTSAAATITFTVPVDGDMDENGTVDIRDALFALRSAVNLVTPTAVQKAHGDCAPLGAPNGALDIADALLILRKVVGLIEF